MIELEVANYMGDIAMFTYIYIIKNKFLNIIFKQKTILHLNNFHAI